MKGNVPPRIRRYGRFDERGLDPSAADKLRGGYYTPVDIARWMCEWGIRTSQDRILEPSSGDGIFLESSAVRLLHLGAAAKDIARQVTGVEIIPGEAIKGAARLSRALDLRARASVRCVDFFAWQASSPGVLFDFVVGNPPFIRYQSIPEPSRSAAMALLEQSGLRPNRLTNLWVPFVVGSTVLLAPGGRLGLVLPAELLQVFYAAQLRSYLLRSFESLQIFACNDLLFKNAEQEVVLLLAEGRRAGPSVAASYLRLTEARTADEVLSRPAPVAPRGSPGRTTDSDHEKWLTYFLAPREIAFLRGLKRAPEIAPLGKHASVDVGVVTGKNDFFVLTSDDVTRLDLKGSAIPIVSKSSQLEGAILTEAELRSLGEKGQKVFLLYLDSARRLSKAVRSYLREGERLGHHLGYKCSIRKPWYSLPEGWAPCCFFFRQIHDFPRVVVNRARATSTDTIHRLRCDANAERLAENLHTHLTAASAETEGRSYGGGVLELEPTEAERLLAPANLGDAMPLAEIDRLIRAGRLDDVLCENDARVLRASLGLSRSECLLLRTIWEKMKGRRHARRRLRRAQDGPRLVRGGTR